MSNPASDGIHLTKEYAREGFLPTDLQWTVAEIAADFTLYDLFRLVYQAEIMIPNIAAAFGMSNFDAFWDQINLDRDPDDIDNVEYLELYWELNYDTRETKKTGKSTDQGTISGLSDIFNQDVNLWDDPKIGELPNLMGFHGIGPGCPSKGFDLHECGDDCAKDQGYGIEFTPVNNLAHLPICVSPKVEFFPPYVESDRDFHCTGFQLTIEPTLYCFITSIFWELTFAGSTPNEVADHMEEISDRVEEAREHFKENLDEESDDNPLVS